MSCLESLHTINITAVIFRGNFFTRRTTLVRDFPNFQCDKKCFEIWQQISPCYVKLPARANYIQGVIVKLKRPSVVSYRGKLEILSVVDFIASLSSQKGRGRLD